MSASTDKIDDIYHNKDPIKISIAQRIEAGQTVMSQVRGEKKLEFFYELGLKGKGLENAQKNENYTADKKRSKSPLEVENGSPNRKELHKEIFSGMKKEDRVDKAIKERMAAGNYLTVVPNAETH